MMLEGVRLMAVGMSTVFGFLALLVVAVQVTARAVAWFPEPEPPAPPPDPAGDDQAIAAVLAIVAAQRGVR